jgi:hypothetical protein
MEIKKVLIYQPGRFGDIFFILPIARRLIEKGYEVVYPVYKRRHDVSKHFPDVNMPVLDPKHPEELVNNGYVTAPHETHILLPLWNGAYWKKARGKYTGDDLMNCKYEMYNETFDDNLDKNTYWHNLTWKRFPEKEKELAEVLELKPNEKYVLINEMYAWGRVPINLKTDLRKVYFKPVNGFSMLDWSGIIENAEEIHCVDCAVLYVIDRLNTTNNLHRYRRAHEDVEIGHILKKKYVKHFVDGSIEHGI